MITVSLDKINNIQFEGYGPIKFHNTYSSKKLFNTSDIAETGLSHNTLLISLFKIEGDKIQVLVAPTDSKRSVKEHTIDETTMLVFKFPEVMMIKGQREIIVYDVTYQSINYIPLNSPLAYVAASHNIKYGLNIEGLIDFGDYLAFVTLEIRFSSNSSLLGKVHQNYLFKSSFPDSKLVAVYSPLEVKYIQKDAKSFILLFKDKIYTVSMEDPSLTQLVDSNYTEQEMIYDSCTKGIYLWKEGGKAILHKSQPYNFDEK